MLSFLGNHRTALVTMAANGVCILCLASILAETSLLRFQGRLTEANGTSLGNETVGAGTIVVGQTARNLPQDTTTEPRPTNIYVNHIIKF